MKFSKVVGAYFSATNTTKTMVCYIAKGIAAALEIPFEEFDFTLPKTRQEPKNFAENELVIFGTPVYAGRVPNVLLKYLATVTSNGGVAVPVVMFGNRNFDNALIELRDILKNNGFTPVAAAAFSAEHSFSYTLGANRPDKEDFLVADSFVKSVAKKLLVANSEQPAIIEVSGIGEPTYGGYYQPRDRHENPIDIRKVKPLTSQKCDNCGVCVAVCPMGSINPEDVREFLGICIKCGACIKKCPKQAKYYEDEGYIYHKEELEEMYARRAEPTLFV